MAKAPWDRQYGFGARGLYQAGVVFAPLMAAPAIGYALMAASAAMTVIGAVQQSSAQNAAGAAAAANGRAQQVQLNAQAQEQEAEAKQQRDKANTDAAIGERNEIEATRQGHIMAGRAQAVMGAAGAGVDNSMTAGLLAQGDYNAKVAEYDGMDRARMDKNQANINDYNALSLRTRGGNGVISGDMSASAYGVAANASLYGGLAKAGLSIASKYGGSIGGDTTDPYLSSSPADQVRADVAAERQLT